MKESTPMIAYAACKVLCVVVDTYVDFDAVVDIRVVKTNKLKAVAMKKMTWKHLLV